MIYFAADFLTTTLYFFFLTIHWLAFLDLSYAAISFLRQAFTWRIILDIVLLKPNSSILTTLVKNTISLFAKTIALEFPLYDKTMKLCLASRSMDKYNLSHELKEGVAQKHEQGCFTWM